MDLNNNETTAKKRSFSEATENEENVDPATFKMSKIDEFNNVLNCNYCHNLYETPVFLPCGESVCLNDLSKMQCGANEIKCFMCTHSHEIPECGFPSDKKIQKLIDLQMHKLNFNKMFPNYNDCETKLNALKTSVQLIEDLTTDPDNFIYEYFNDIRNQVDLRRETLKQQIDEISDDIIDSINKTEHECKQSVQHVEDIEQQLAESKAFLAQILGEFNSIELSVQKLDQIKNKISGLEPQLLSKLEVIKKSLLLNNGGYLFEKDLNIHMKNVFGTFESFHLYFDESNILKNEDQHRLVKLCEFNKGQKFRLIYKASVHGFSSRSFHLRCDPYEKTLILIKTTQNSVFGGYTEANWSGNRYKSDPNAFIFSLFNRDNVPLKMACKPKEHAISCRPNQGPCFGRNDIYISIANDSNLNHNSSYSLGNTNRHPIINPTDSNSLLATKSRFQTSEIEVYQFI